MKAKIAMVTAMVLATAACTPPVYTKPGGTQSQFDMDKADCQMKFAASPWATNPFMAADFGKTCMQSKGYGQVAKGGKAEIQAGIDAYVKDKVAIPPPTDALQGVLKFCGTGASAPIIIECLHEHGVTFLSKDQYASYVQRAFPDGVKVDEHGVPLGETDKLAVRKLVWADLPVNDVKQ